MTKAGSRERQKEYERTYRKKAVCDMNCFGCIFKDCINNRASTKKEKEMLSNAMGYNTPEYQEQKKRREKQKRSAYMHERYLRLKEEGKR